MLDLFFPSCLVSRPKKALRVAKEGVGALGAAMWVRALRVTSEKHQALTWKRQNEHISIFYASEASPVYLSICSLQLLLSN